MEIRLHCENCAKPLPNDSDEAMVCTFDCTFCRDCVNDVLENVCPNCGGGFEKRPTRPQHMLEKYPVRKDQVLKPVTENKFLEQYRNIDPRKR